MLAVLLAAIAVFLLAVHARMRRARAAVHRALADAGYEVLRLRYRALSFGSGFGLPGHGQFTYRLVARDCTGKERRGWARWGRVWLPDPDRLQLRWDDEPGGSS